MFLGSFPFFDMKSRAATSKLTHKMKPEKGSFASGRRMLTLASKQVAI